jgi:hypothetical protein
VQTCREDRHCTEVGLNFLLDSIATGFATKPLDSCGAANHHIVVSSVTDASASVPVLAQPDLLAWPRGPEPARQMIWISVLMFRLRI